MSSRELLALLDDLPEDSTFREKAERTFRLVELASRELRIFPLVGALPEGAKVEATYTDWTMDRKIAARLAQEVALSRADGKDYQPDLDGLREPLHRALSERESRLKRIERDGASSVIKRGLYANHQGGDH